MTSRPNNWGPEIVVNGVRPAWLTGVVQRLDLYTEDKGWETDAWWVSAINPVEEFRWMKDGKPYITKIRLAADHACYSHLPAHPIMSDIMVEIERAVAKFPTWPTDPFHALAVVGEEYGELQKAVVQHTYEPHKGVTPEDIRAEAVQTAAMAIRWAMSLTSYEVKSRDQHEQEPLTPAMEVV